MGDRIGATEVLKAAFERDPEELEPSDMVGYLRSAIKSSLYLLGADVGDDEYATDYPSHADQLAADNHSDSGYIGGDLGYRSGW